MSYRARRLMESVGLHQFKNRWQVEVSYKDGTPNRIFRVDELEDIDERIECEPDWRTIDKIVITLKKYVPFSVFPRRLTPRRPEDRTMSALHQPKVRNVRSNMKT